MITDHDQKDWLSQPGALLTVTGQRDAIGEGSAEAYRALSVVSDSGADSKSAPLFV
jgi:hypothetical protein